MTEMLPVLVTVVAGAVLLGIVLFVAVSAVRRCQRAAAEMRSRTADRVAGLRAQVNVKGRAHGHPGTGE